MQPSGAQMRVNVQLIDAASGAHLCAEQFDTARADLLQMQDEIVMHLARALEVRLTEVEAARLKRTPAANPDAEDLALQCQAAAEKAGLIGREADAGYALCEQALRVDPNNVRALIGLAIKFFLPVGMGTSADPRPTLGGRTNCCRKPSPSIQPTSGLTTKSPGIFSTRRASRRPSRNWNGRSPWSLLFRAPFRAWLGITSTSGNMKGASNYLTRRFGSVRAIHSCISYILGNRGRISG